MKKLLYTFVIALAAHGAANACGGDYDDFDTYNSWFFSAFAEDNLFFAPNEYKGNISDWAKYLNIAYEDAEYLVLKVKKNEIEAAINGYPSDPKLKFMTSDFVKKNRRALQYLVCAKTIEPYATRNYESYWAWSYYYDEGPCVSELGEDFIENLKMACESETDKELKLRYGYQLVRFAHYMHRNSDAVDYFNKYVEPLNIKNEVYYYALNQKAGAEYNLQKYTQAVQDFMTVYVNSTDQKESTYRSIFTFCDGYYTPNSLIQMCKTQEQKFDMYLLIAYSNFVDPLQFAKKITVIDPDAPQARKLVAKQIRQLEAHYQDEVISQSITIDAGNDFRLTANDKFYSSTIEYLQQMTQRASDADFWNMALGYVYFLNSDYELAKATLDKVSAKTKNETPDIKNIYSYIDICQLKTVTKETETKFFNDHKDILVQYPVGEYLCKVLANRYFVAEDYTKAFLLASNVYRIQEYFPTSMIESVIALAQKKDKTPMEEWLTQFIDADVDKSLKQTVMKGAIAKADIGKAIELKKKYEVNDMVPVEMFYHNIDNTYWLEYNMYGDYVAEVVGTDKKVSVTEILNKLMQTAEGDDAVAAKANYVLGNFFYNLSHVGCCRHYLKGYESASYYSSSYENYMNTDELEVNTFDKNKKQQDEYFPVVNGTYSNTIPIAEKYFNRAKQLSFDNEFAAHVVFGLIKCDQAKNQKSSSWDYFIYASPMFEQIATTYTTTKYANEVRSYCKYYHYYESFLPEGEME